MLFTKFIRVLKSSPYFKNVATLSIGTLVSQAVPIVVVPIITRLYSPDDFGVLALYLSFVSIMGSVASGRFDVAMLQKMSDYRRRIALYRLSIIISVGVSFGAVFVTIPSYFLATGTNTWLLLLPIGIILSSAYKTHEFHVVYKSGYRSIATARFINSLSTGVFRIAWGFLGLGPFGLIYGQISGLVLQLGFLVFRNPPTTELREKLKVKYLGMVAKRNIKYPKYSLPSVLLNTISKELPILLLSGPFGKAAIGQYFQANKVLNLPVGILGSSVSQVFLERASKLKEDKIGLGRLTLKTFRTLFFLGLLPISVLTVFSDWIFVFLLGDQWLDASQFARPVGVFVLFSFACSPLQNLTLILSRQQDGLIYNSLSIAVKTLTLVTTLYFLREPLIVISIFLGVSTVMLYIYSLYLFHRIQIRILDVVKITFPPLIMMFGVLILLRNYFF